MITVTVYTSLDIGIEEVEVKAKELALLLSYYTGKGVDLNIVILPLSSSELIWPSVRVNDVFFNILDVSEIVAKVLLSESTYQPLLYDNMHVASIA